MIQVIVSMLRQMEGRGRRAVVVVPQALYHKALLGLACQYQDNAGRTARMDNGQLVSVVSPDTTMDLPDDYDLYLCGWGAAKPQEERLMSKWSDKAKHLYVEIQ